MVRTIVLVVSGLAILIGLAVLAAGPGTRFGIWDFTIGLSILQLAAIPVLLAAISALFGLGLALWKARRHVPLGLAALVIAGGAASVPLQMKAAAEANPYIHDITTDFDNPPEIVAAATAARMNPVGYRGRDAVPGARSPTTVSEVQRAAFPDIVPIEIAGDVKTVAAEAREIVEAMGMEILSGVPGAPQSPTRLEIEAVATSFWFGFKDDFVIRLIEQPGSLTRVDVRSKSRVGVSDLGANAARIRKFTKELRTKEARRTAAL